MGTASRRTRPSGGGSRKPKSRMRNVLLVTLMALTGLLVIAFLLYLADGTPLGALPVAGIMWVVLAPVPAFVAARNGRSFLGWLVLSLVISPVIGLAVVLAIGKPAYLRQRHSVRRHEFVIPL